MVSTICYKYMCGHSWLDLLMVRSGLFDSGWLFINIFPIFLNSDSLTQRGDDIVIRAIEDILLKLCMHVRQKRTILWMVFFPLRSFISFSYAYNSMKFSVFIFWKILFDKCDLCAASCKLCNHLYIWYHNNNNMYVYRWLLYICVHNSIVQNDSFEPKEGLYRVKGAIREF